MRTRTALLALLLLSACGTGSDSGGSVTTTTAPTFAVSGYAHSGPTCPVVLPPPNPTCDDRPVADATLLITTTSGAVVAEVRTGEDGTFEVELAPGSYRIVPQPVEGLMGTAPEVSLFVVDGPVTGLDFAYDTGIR